MGSLLIDAGAFALAAFNRDAMPPRSRSASAPPRRDEPPTRQLLRARGLGLGRGATSPSHIPWKGWKDIFWRTASQVSQNRLLAISAAVVFYGLLALFPAIAALVSSHSLFAVTTSIPEHPSFAAAVMAADAFSIAQDQIARVDAKLSFGFGFTLWSANACTKAIIDALNVVDEEHEKRGFVRLNLISLAFAAGAYGARCATMADTVGAAQST
jgi:membrane protein